MSHIIYKLPKEDKELEIIKGMNYEQLRHRVMSGEMPVYIKVKYRINVNSATDILYQEYLSYQGINKWDYMSILRMSILIEDKELFNYLMSKNDLNLVVNDDLGSIVLTAFNSDELYYLRKLVEAGVDIVNPSIPFLEIAMFHFTPSLFYVKDEYKLVEYYLSCGGDVSYDKTDPHQSLAVKAALCGKVKVVKVLLNHMYDAGLVIAGDETQQSGAYNTVLNVKDLDINTERSFKLLFAHSDLDINAVDKEGRNFLSICITRMSFISAHFFLSAGIDINHLDKKGKLVIEIDPEEITFENGQFMQHMVKVHIVLLIAADFYVCNKNLETVSGNKFKKLHQDCNKEVELLKATKICGIKYTYYDLLHVSHHKIVLRLQSIDKSVVLDEDSLVKRFPRYAGMIVYQLEKLEQRRQLMKSAFCELYDIFKYELPDTLLYDLYYYLSNYDLTRLLK